jgi:hypothetical protein
MLGCMKFLFSGEYVLTHFSLRNRESIWMILLCERITSHLIWNLTWHKRQVATHQPNNNTTTQHTHSLGTSPMLQRPRQQAIKKMHTTNSSCLKSTTTYWHQSLQASWHLQCTQRLATPAHHKHSHHTHLHATKLRALKVTPTNTYGPPRRGLKGGCGSQDPPPSIQASMDHVFIWGDHKISLGLYVLAAWSWPVARPPTVR